MGRGGKRRKGREEIEGRGLNALAGTEDCDGKEVG